MSKFGFGFGAPVMGPLAGFGANNGRVMQSRRLPAFAPVPDQAFATDPTLLKREEAMRAEMALRQQQALAQQAMQVQAGPMPPQAPAPEQPMPDQPIKAPKDRGMFGRFVGGLGKVAGKAGEFAMFGPVGMQIRADHRRGEERAEQKAAEEEARRQQMLQQLSGMPGVTDQQRMLLGMGLGVDQITNQAFAPPAATPKPLEHDGLFLDPDDPTKILADYRAQPETQERWEPVPAPEGMPGYYERSTKTGQTRRVAAPQSGGMTVGVDENGNPVIQFGGPGVGSVFGKSGESTGAKAFGTALEDAGTADATLALANQAKAIIEGGYNSGIFAPIKGAIGQVAGEFGLGDKGATADFEQFQAINSQLAAQMLKLFGGSDTERELAISISSNIGPKFSEETNRRMLAALEKTVATQRQKPEFIAQWTRRHGSLDAIDQTTGLGYQATWDRYLQEQAGMYSNAASDTAQVGMESAAQGLLPADKMSRLEELRRKRDAGSIR